MRTLVWKANFIVFIGSACTMIIELVASRILAPYVGVSLYTWTSIIGVVLAGISLGNYLGGRLADRWASRTTLGLLFFASGLTSLSILGLTQFLTTSTFPSSVPLIARIVLYATIIFFVPSCVLGMLSPLVVKLTLRDLADAGKVVGLIYACSALGSIFGTFLTGFVLISLLGTRTIVWLVALVLLLMGAVFGEFWRSRQGQVSAVLVFLVFGLTYYAKSAEYQAPCQVESDYFCIRVQDTTLAGVSEGASVKQLVLDHLVHSYVVLGDPTVLGYGYERVYAEVVEYANRDRTPIQTLFIGGGGYTFPRWVQAIYPGSGADVVEIDPAVTGVVHEQMGLPITTTIRTFNEDARMFMARPADVKYDFVFGDAFNDLSVPYHLTTREFNDAVRSQMADDGIYMLNIIDSYEKGEFLRAMVNTLRQTFPTVHVLSPGLGFGSSASTYVILASVQPFDLEEFKQTVGKNGEKSVLSNPLAQEKLEAYLRQGRQFLLTDDYAPVDNLVAPLFVERGL